MCGIVGYVGERPCKELLLEGLERLEYRGYDSAGICLINGEVDIVRRVGRVGVLRDAVGNGSHPATLGLAHTRWATHGGVTEGNAHPVEACEGSGVTVVHNGIIENYVALRRRLADEGHDLPHRHRLRGDRAPRREPLLRRPGRRRQGCVRRAARPLRVRRRASRPRRGDRGGAPPVPAGGRRRRRRDVHGVRHPRVPQADAPRAVRAGRRDRGRPSRGCDVHDRRRRRDRARGRGGRLGRRRGREAGLRDVHAQGDPRAAGRHRRDDRRAALPRRAPAGRPRADRGSDPRPVARRHPGLRHGVPRRADRPLPARGVGAAPRASRTSPASGATGGR